MIVRFLVSALALGLATWALPGIRLDTTEPADAIVTILIVAAIFGVVNTAVKPLFQFTTSIVALVLLGLALLVVNAALLLLTSWVCGLLGVGWSVHGFWWAVLGALIVSVVSFLLNSVMGRRGEVHT